MTGLGPYRISGTLGEGGMGVVYAAHDERLDRPVAVKVIRASSDPTARQRLWREARTAARLNHPNICQVYEVGETDGQLYIVMERLEGESLSARLARGPLATQEAVQGTLAMLGALEALNQQGLVHRDLKPSNVFLTKHGPKLLDFGLARAALPDTASAETAVTLPGVMIGTPQYMSPEQASGQPVDIRSDLFTVAAILYEMLTGRPAFPGRTAVEVLHAILHSTPPALAGSELIVAIDHVIRRALEKRPDDRYRTPEAMAQALRDASGARDTGPSDTAVVARPTTRLIVLPFRMLRPDPDAEFLSFSLADAITCSLSGLESIVVRSSLTASRYAGTTPDLQTIAREANVDVVLTGSVLAAERSVRVAAQLTETAGGALIWSQAFQVSQHDLFKLQDEIVQRIVESLALPLSTRERRLLRHDVPASATAYEYYLRANQLSTDSRQWITARDLYQQCVELDPNYAPAWCRLGRCYRLLAKYLPEGNARENLTRAHQALDRALQLNPDLPMAHGLATMLDVERGRPKEAMVRLLTLLPRQPAEPELYAALVHACRYCGLLDASVAAYEAARRLDPAVRTSVAHTYLARGDYEAAIAADLDVFPYVSLLALKLLGREDEIARRLDNLRQARPGESHLEQMLRRASLSYFARDQEDVLADGVRHFSHEGFTDPEGWVYWSILLGDATSLQDALALLSRAVHAGYSCDTMLRESPLLSRLRGHAAFGELIERAMAQRKEAEEAFREHGGRRLLGQEALAG
ncbi:MAG TPA: protein kinase [Vicinamibacterales bacterium]|nr:protein kinase [Vicinamibacterales bacterium]